MANIQFKVTKPATIDPNTIGIRILNTLKKYDKLIRADYDSATSTWQHDPNFTSELRYAGGDVRLLVTTDDEVFGYLDGGTSVRHAVMTRDFQPKTRPGSLSSSGGAGGVARVSRNIQMPGIEAREFSLQVREKHEKNFARDCRKAVSDGIKAGRKKQ